jgi:hypothetical protein
MHRCRWALLAGACAAAVAASARPARAADGDGERVNVRAEIGAEYDSNVHRAEQLAGVGAPRVASPLVRGVLGWSAASRLGNRHDVAFSVLGAGKLFAAPEARSENVGIVETGGSWRVAAGTRTRLGLSGAYYEAVQSGTPTERAIDDVARDFRSLAPTAVLARALGASGALLVGAGYRWFVYKPLRTYDFTAPVLSLQYRWADETADGSAEWELVAGATAELRRFAGVRLLAPSELCTAQGCETSPDPAGTRHQDQFVTGQIEVSRTGLLLLGVGYAAHWNRSNSYTESLIRHIGILRLTAPLVLGVYLAARAELVYVQYSNPVALAVGPSGRPSATFEEEGRSQIRAELSRDLGSRAQLIGRGVFYTNFLTNLLGERAFGYDYRRFTITLSVAFGF